MKIKAILLLIAACNLFFVCAHAQTNDSIDSNKSKIYLEHTDRLSRRENLAPNTQVLIGNVVFRHDSTFMYCDSACYYPLTNSLEAFFNVRIEQGDTLVIYGDWLYYDGNIQLARLRNNVKMDNNQVTLLTDSLNYSRIENVGYYFDGGVVIDEENTLSSFFGQYSPDTKLAIFNNDVKFINPQFILYSDTLHYDTNIKIATILGPSIIETDSGTVHTSRGWYNTATGVSLLLDNSQVASGNRILIGDSIHYDKSSGFTEVFGNMILRDTSRSIILEGQYGYYNERTEMAFATDSARFMEYSTGDTLYLYADTLQMATIDTTFRELKAYHSVRFYRIDLQGVCDSMLFNTKDSTLHMYSNPVLWNNLYQLYGDTILIYMNDSTVDRAHIRQFAFAVQYLDTTYYNQLKGNDMVAFFNGSWMRQIDVSGNAESLFYPLDNGAMIGLNQTKSAYLTIWLKENQLERLKLWPESEGSLIPIPDLKPEQKTLTDFFWYDYLRPLNKNDIYRKVKRKTSDAPRRSNKFVH
jgi:lipopolysaccharide assembly outer membrane protein LptD (OstA)